MTKDRREIIGIGAYFVAYLVYLFLYQEGEAAHWIALVTLPGLIVWLAGGRPSFGELLRRVGIGATPWRAGMGLVLVLGIPFQLLQLLNGPQRTALFEALAGPTGWLAPLLAFGLLIGTAAFTEEFFFRGVIQTRVHSLTSSPLAGIAVATTAFILFHVPYAYLSPTWPSTGDLAHAIRLAGVNGGLGGVALGWVFHRSGGNLYAVVALHALINLIPATRLVHSWMG